MIKNNKQQLFRIMKEAINSSKPNNKFPKLLWILLSYFIAIFNYELFNSLINDLNTLFFVFKIFLQSPLS